jgi:DNA-binding NarL/FixJ family response regulator
MRFASEGTTLRSVVQAAESNDRDIPVSAGRLVSRWESRDGYDRVSEALTAREQVILAMISQGLSNKRIARTLKISPETVKSHVKNIFLKLDVSTRAAAVSRAGAFGLL